MPKFILCRIEHRPNLVKIVGNIGWLFIDKIVRIGIGLLVGVWVARYLGPQQFGLLNFATAFVGVYGPIAALGLQAIVVRDIVRNPSMKEEILGTAGLLHMFAGCIAYMCIMLTVSIVRPDDNQFIMLVAILASGMLFKFSDIAVYWFESQVQSKYTVLVQNGAFVFFAITKVVLIYNMANLLAFAWVSFAENLAVALSLLAILGAQGPKLKQLKVSADRAKKMIKDSWPLLLSGLAIMVYMKIDQIMLGQMDGDQAVGVFSAATRISEAWYFVPMVIVSSVFPAILDAKHHNEQLYRTRLERLYTMMIWLSIGAAIPMTFVAEPIVTTLFGSAYSESGQVLSIHFWASVFVFLGVASNTCFLAENRQILCLQRTVIGAVVNVALNLVLIPKYGAIGAAWATVIAQFSVGLLADVFQKETHPMFFMKINAFDPRNITKLIKTT